MKRLAGQPGSWGAGADPPPAFFALRTPLLPFDELLHLGAGLRAAALDAARIEGPGLAALEQALADDRRLIRGRLRDLVARPAVREALFLASPSLDESLPLWLADPESDRGQKVERTLCRYLPRMAGRATPFGLFAGCSLGTMVPAGQANFPAGEAAVPAASPSRLTLSGLSSYRRHTRLDGDYLGSLTEQLAQAPALQAQLYYRPNSSLYRIGGRLRYAEARLDGRSRSYLHMHANRVLRSAARAQELVLHDLLERLYASRLARARGT